MKFAITALLILCLAGCATRPMSPQERAYRLQMIGIATQSHYVLPPPPALSIPQTRIYTANCMRNGVMTSCTVQ